MNGKYIAAIGVLFGSAAIIWIFVFANVDTSRTSENLQNTTNSTSPRADSSTTIDTLSIKSNGTNSSNNTLAQHQIELALQEIKTRLAINQPEAALNELNGLLEGFDDMSLAEKSNLLTAYASYFLKKSQFDDAIFFYEKILLLPGLDYTNRLAVLQMLARISMAAEDWGSFLAYNDQYFEEGGGYNWVVTRNLINAYQRLENFNSAGESLLLQFETGIHPEFDGSVMQYQRIYGNMEAIPLRMSDSESALKLAVKMTEQFDQPGNWRVLSEQYRNLGDGPNFDRTISIARERGFLTESGDWITPATTQ